MTSGHKRFEAAVRGKIGAMGKHQSAYVGDGGGLYLQIPQWRNEGDGGRMPLGRPASWVFRYRSRSTGKLRELGLGPYGDVSLAQARAAAATCRDKLRALIDPIDEKRQARASLAASAAKSITFDEAAAQYIAAHRQGWKNSKHHAQWESTLANYASPVIGKMEVGAVDLQHVLRILEPIWATKPETASRLRGRLESILDWAAVRGYRHGENPARWKGHLEHLLKSRGELAGAGHVKAKVRHHPALPFNEIGGFMQLLRNQPGTAALALEFTILTAARTAETIGTLWGEIDLERGLWLIPAERMKAKKAHTVPLGERAIEILNGLKGTQSPTGYVFPGGRSGQPLSNMAMLKLLQRMGRTDLTVHGFRSTFRDWASEATNHDRDVVEMALAHTIGNSVESAYRRGDLLAKRAKLMTDWDRRCAKPDDVAIATVIPMRAVSL
jgi:integrase